MSYRFRSIRGLHLTIALFIFNALALLYIYFPDNTHQSKVLAWPLKSKNRLGSDSSLTSVSPQQQEFQSSQVIQTQDNQISKSLATILHDHDGDSHSHSHSHSHAHAHAHESNFHSKPAEPPISTVFVTPRVKTTTFTKATTITVTASSLTTATVTQVQTQTVQVEVSRPPPPDGPRFCNVCGPHDVYCHRYGEHNLDRARTYEGSNTRFRRVLRKALAGEPILIGVLGGSVTKGHGLTNPDQNWTLKFLEEMRKLLPMSQIELVNGAVPATGTDYFSMCFQVHIPQDVDMVIIELAVNDQRIEPSAVSYEWLLRGLLDLPKRPAILNIQVMALAFETITLGGDLHTPIAQFYDTPILNLRNMLLPHILKNAPLDKHYFFLYEKDQVDFRHISRYGHAIVADLLAAYTQRQLCAIEKEKTQLEIFLSKDGKLPNRDDLEDIPRLRLFDKYSRTKVVGGVKPSCHSIRDPAHHLIPIETEGWRVSKWTYKGDQERPYLKADKVGDYIKFEVQVGVMGRVRITYLRSKTYNLGDVLCWIDTDREHGTRIQSWWEYEQFNLARVSVVADNIEPGKHNLTCEILPETSDPNGGHEFRLIAVDSA